MHIKNHLHVARVVKNDDSQHKDGKKQGRVQISVDYLMDGFSPDHLPWARPFFSGTGGSAEFGRSDIPEENSQVWVFFYDEPRLKQAFYVADVAFADLNPHEFFEKNIASKVESASKYPNTKWKAYKNQITIGVDSSDDNPEIFFYHPQGTFGIIDKNGKTTINSKDELLLVSGGGGGEESSLLGETLKTTLEKLIDEIKLIIVPTGVGPSGTPTNAAKFDLIKNDLTKILSKKTKNN